MSPALWRGSWLDQGLSLGTLGGSPARPCLGPRLHRAQAVPTSCDAPHLPSSLLLQKGIGESITISSCLIPEHGAGGIVAL